MRGIYMKRCLKVNSMWKKKNPKDEMLFMHEVRFETDDGWDYGVDRVTVVRRLAIPLKVMYDLANNPLPEDKQQPGPDKITALEERGALAHDVINSAGVVLPSGQHFDAKTGKELYREYSRHGKFYDIALKIHPWLPVRNDIVPA